MRFNSRRANWRLQEMPVLQNGAGPKKSKKTVTSTEWSYCDVNAVWLAATDRIEAQTKEIDALRNELCLKCGNYTLAHEGACNGCRWRR